MTVQTEPSVRDRARATAARTWQLGAGRSAAATYPVHDPFDGAHVADVPDAAAEDVAEVVAAAEAGFAAWRGTSLRERATAVRAMAERVRAHADELAVLDALCVGNPVARTRGSLARAAEGMEFFADSALELQGATLPVSPHLHYTRREPYGVVARITAYNSPAFFAALKIAPVLMAGNALVLKAPDPAPLSALRLGELVADLVPEGVLSIVTGAGPVAGAALVAHPAVQRISFIGGTETGRAIQRTAAGSGVKDVTLELGGKNPMVVFADADPAAVATAAAAIFTSASGQSCGSPSRLIVHESLVAEVTTRIAEIAERLVLGDPLDAGTQLGPLVSQAHARRVLEIVTDTGAAGARLVTGGDAPGGELAAGHFVRPTVLADVRPEHRAFREEIFGPVLTITGFAEDAEALALANDTPYGLTASIWTRDVTRAHRAAAGVEAGYVWVNTSGPHFWGVPFGGVKASGVGREEGAEELRSFTRTKAVTVALR